MKQEQPAVTETPKPLSAEDLASLEQRTERQNLAVRSGVRAGQLRYRFGEP